MVVALHLPLERVARDAQRGAQLGLVDLEAIAPLARRRIVVAQAPQVQNEAESKRP